MEETGFIVNKDFKPHVLKIVFKRFWFVLPILIFLFGFGAYLYLRYTQPIYMSNAVIQLSGKDQSSEILGIKSPTVKKDVSKIMELLQSPLMFERTAKALNIPVSYFSQGKILTEEKQKSGNYEVTIIEIKDSSLLDKPIFVELEKDSFYLVWNLKTQKRTRIPKSGNIETPQITLSFIIYNQTSFYEELKENKVYFKINSLNSLAKRLRSGFTTELFNPEAKSVQLLYNDKNPEFCQQVLKQHIEEFFKYEKEREIESHQNILDFISHQLDSVNAVLNSSRDSIMAFHRLTKRVDLTDDLSFVSKKNADLNDRIFNLEMDLVYLKTIEKKLLSDITNLDLYRILGDLVGKSYQSSLQKHIEDLNIMVERREALSRDVTKENYVFKRNEELIQQKKESILVTIETIKERTDLNLYLLRQKTYELRENMLNIPEQNIALNQLQETHSLDKKYYSLLMDKKSSFTISMAGYVSKNLIIQAPTLNNNPISPNRNLIYAVGLVLGFFFGLAYILMKYVSYDQVNSESDIRSIIPNVSFIGSIPKITSESIYSQLVVHEKPKSSISEAFRGVRSNLNFINPDAKVFAISSSISGEGKTFIGLNFAGIKAMTGKKTVLIDLDLRKPKVHLGLNCANDKGMSTLLSNQHTLEECIQQSPVENMDFISAGPIPPNPSELILSNKMTAILEELKTLYDIIVIDNPPIGIVTDGMSLFSKADCSIYVFKVGYSKHTFAYRVKELYDSNNINGLTVLLNGVERKKSGYGYGYGYGYGGYYEDEPQAKWFHKLMFWRKHS